MNDFKQDVFTAKAQARAVAARDAELSALDTALIARAKEDVSKIAITGELTHWVRDVRTSGRMIIWGHIQNDVHGRFHDGTWIHTSAIAKIEKGVAVTLNSAYRLIGAEKE